MIIIKLGGSVITVKDEYATLNETYIDSISRELAGSATREPIILVHGAGSFGHILAKKYSLKDPGDREDLPMGIARVQKDVRQLNLVLVKSLTDHGIPAVPIPPAICAQLEDGELAEFDIAIFKRFMELNTVPITFGDVVPDGKRKVSILSGDTIMERLADVFHTEMAIFVLDEDGFFDRPPSDPEAALYGILTPDELEDILTTTPESSKNMNEMSGQSFLRVQIKILA